MRKRPRVALLIETSNVYAREILQGLRGYLREHSPWSLYLTEHGRGDVIPTWLSHWDGDGIIARVENQSIAQAVAATNVPVVDVSYGLEESPFPRIVTDSPAVSRMAAEHDGLAIPRIIVPIMGKKHSLEALADEMASSGIHYRNTKSEIR